MSLALVFADIFAGLGLFFIGVKLIGGHLKQMAGRGFRERVAHAVHSPWRAGFLGVLAGALTQSTNAVAFIVTSMSTAGLLTVRKAMPLVIWANLGTSALVMVTTVDLNLAVLYLLGVVGLAYYFDVDKSNRWRHVLGAVLGVALLFLGLQLIKQGAAPLRALDEVRGMLQLASQYSAFIFLVGAAITLVVQASGTVSVVAVTMTQAGLLTLDDTMLVIYGAGLGSAASLWFMSANLRGIARQLILLQIGFKCLAAALLLILLMLERGFGWPLMKALATGLSTEVGRQAAWVFLLYQLTGGLAMSLLTRPAYRLLQRWAPPSRAEVLARPRYLFDQALDDAPTALDLVEREQARLVNCLPAYLSRADMTRTGEQLEPMPLLLPANRAVANQIGEFITELMRRHPDGQSLGRMLNLRGRNRILDELREGLSELDQRLTQPAALDAPERQGLEQGIIDALHFLLLNLAEAAATADPDDLELLHALTADRSEVVEGLRQRLLLPTDDPGQAARERLYAATSLFERLVWLIRQYGQLLKTA